MSRTVALACLAIGVSVALVEARSPSPVRPLVAASASPDGSSLALSIDAAEYERMWQRGSVLLQGLPLAGRGPVDLELVAFRVAPPHARFVAEGEGVMQPFSPRPMRFFRGRVFGEPDSLAYVWMGRDRIGGFVRMDANPAGTWTFGPRAARSDRPESGEHVVTRSDGWRPAAAEPFCGVEASRFSGLRELPATTGVNEEGLLVLEVAIDTTFDFTREFENEADAASYVLSLMGAVSTLYQAEVATRVDVVFLRLFTHPGPPYGSPVVPIPFLEALALEWTTNPEVMGIERDLAHGLHYYGGGTGGLANIDALCDPEVAYAVSYLQAIYTYPDPAYTYDAYVVSHELGHNAGSVHTHCYDPPIDMCSTYPGCHEGPIVQSPGTIMSYCDDADLVFHERVHDVIRPKLLEASCVSTAGDPGSIGADGSPGLELAKSLVEYPLENDDGISEGTLGVAGTVRQAWVKRFTPPCHPFVIERVDVLFEGVNVEVGRPIELLVYADPAATGDVSGATLVYTEPVEIEVVSVEEWNEYPLTEPVTLDSGDTYIGFHDLVADPPNNWLVRWDLDPWADDSYLAYDSTDPAAYTLDSNRTWMTRAYGHCGEPTLELSWSASCNDASVPNQDYAVYQGTLLPPFDDHASLTCSTEGHLSWPLFGFPEDDVYFVVVPIGDDAEGDYGTVPVAAAPCRPLQEIGPCD